ncbi:ribonuclease H-like domain-containing protein [Gigaspora rosea]|uniref:Ribonuclease H-like domain-containing protein n=1 Tax=Gigaspora rosea TaxID=44941 RepID=A0A397VQW8_9GLOM|nr:ribonuclease H-like domain-containing protein [Gigaspora rosea]
MSSEEEVSIASTSIIDKGKQVGKGKYEATCNLCGVTWNRGEPSELENHLANHCQKADSTIIRQFLTKILSNISEHGNLQQLAIVNQKMDKIFKQYSNLTLEHKEYLYKLCDFSNETHTEKFEDVLDSIVIQLVQSILQLLCIAHAINLVAQDILKNEWADKLIKKCNILYNFFKSSHRAGAEIRLLIEQYKIDGGGLKNYSKTRWTTASDTIEKSNCATLGDCYLSLAKSAAAIKKLPIYQQNEFHRYCFNVINNRFKEFDKDLYLLGYFLTPNFRNLGFKKGQFSRIILIVGAIWQKLNNNHTSGHDTPLLWWNSLEPEPTYLQVIALKILAITSNSASCERNFSLFTWLTGNKRIQLSTEKLETIAKLCFDKEILLLDDDLESNLDSDSLSKSNIKTKKNLVLFLEKGLDLDDQIFIDDLEKFPDDNDSDNNYLSENNETIENNETNQTLEPEDYDWNPEDLLMADDD